MGAVPFLLISLQITPYKRKSTPANRLVLNIKKVYIETEEF